MDEKIIREVKDVIENLCDGYLDMPSTCDGCPYGDTLNEDDVCEARELLERITKAE